MADDRNSIESTLLSSLRNFVRLVSPASPQLENTDRQIDRVGVVYLGIFCADVILAYSLLPPLLFESPVTKVAFEVLSLVVGGGAIIAKPEVVRTKLYAASRTKSFRLLVTTCMVLLALVRLPQVPIYSIHTMTGPTITSVCLEPAADADEAGNMARAVNVLHSFECSKNMRQISRRSIRNLRIRPYLVSVSYEGKPLPYMYYVRATTLARLSLFGGELDLRKPQQITVEFEKIALNSTLSIKRVSPSSVDFLGPLVPGCDIEDTGNQTIRCEMTANLFLVLPYGSYEVTAIRGSTPCRVTPPGFSLPGEVTVRYTCP